METEKEQKTGKTDARQIISAGWYAARLVLRLRPNSLRLVLAMRLLAPRYRLLMHIFRQRL
jgi:hypothetical protein